MSKPNAVSWAGRPISQRPVEADQRTELGHWGTETSSAKPTKALWLRWCHALVVTPARAGRLERTEQPLATTISELVVASQELDLASAS